LTNIKILDPDPEVIFDDLARLAAHICGTPIALINFSEGKRQSFKAKVVYGTGLSPRAWIMPACHPAKRGCHRVQTASVLQQVSAEKLQLMHTVAAKA